MSGGTYQSLITSILAFDSPSALWTPFGFQVWRLIGVDSAVGLMGAAVTPPPHARISRPAVPFVSERTMVSGGHDEKDVCGSQRVLLVP